MRKRRWGKTTNMTNKEIIENTKKVIIYIYIYRFCLFQIQVYISEINKIFYYNTVFKPQ